MSNRFTRRRFFAAAAAAGVGLTLSRRRPAPASAFAETSAATEKPACLIMCNPR
jgi:hypothetical protein